MKASIACLCLLLRAAQGLQLPQGLRLCKRVGGDALALALATAPLAQAAQAAAPPSPASLELVQRALDASSQEQKDAVPLLGKAIEAWKKEKLADDELAGLYSLRAKAYQREGDAQKAEADLTAEVTLLKGNSDADPAELPRALLARARLEEARGAHGAARTDARAALALDEDLPNLEQRNPFSYELLARASARDGDFAAAAKFFADAEAARRPRPPRRVVAKNTFPPRVVTNNTFPPRRPTTASATRSARATPPRTARSRSTRRRTRTPSRRRGASSRRNPSPCRTTPTTCPCSRSCRARTRSCTSRSPRGSTPRTTTARTRRLSGRRAVYV